MKVHLNEINSVKALEDYFRNDDDLDQGQGSDQTATRSNNIDIHMYELLAEYFSESSKTMASRRRELRHVCSELQYIEDQEKSLKLETVNLEYSTTMIEAELCEIEERERLLHDLINVTKNIERLHASLSAHTEQTQACLNYCKRVDLI